MPCFVLAAGQSFKLGEKGLGAAGVLQVKKTSGSQNEKQPLHPDFHLIY